MARWIVGKVCGVKVGGCGVRMGGCGVRMGGCDNGTSGECDFISTDVTGEQVECVFYVLSQFP